VQRRGLLLKKFKEPRSGAVANEKNTPRWGGARQDLRSCKVITGDKPVYNHMT